MAKKKPTKITWDKAAKKELKKFTDFVSHCRDFAETIAGQKSHPAVTEEDVADAIQEYAKLWAGMVSKKVVVAAPKPKPKKVLPKPPPPLLDEATENRIAELKKFIAEEDLSDTGFGDPKARIAHWKNEIEELQKPPKKK